MSPDGPSRSADPLARQPWLDLLKGSAILWIFLNHLSERLLGSADIGNPHAHWPPFEERLAQLRPLKGHGVWDLPLNLFRYVGWWGDHAVGLFLILSGLALAWGLCGRAEGTTPGVREFYRRRLARLFPLWWGAHLLFLFWGILGAGSGLQPGLKSVLSLLGVRFLPSLLYYGVPAWWFFGLILQLYAVTPLLWKVQQRWGPARLLALCGAVGFGARAVGLLEFGPLIDFWQRGGIFVTRLPEFGLGMSLAVWLHRQPAEADRRLRSPLFLILASMAVVAGSALALTLLGMTVAPLLISAGAFVLLYAVWKRREASRGIVARACSWMGRHSYSLFLVHQPLILSVIPQDGVGPGWNVAASLGVAGLTGAAAIGLEAGVERAGRWLGRLAGRIGVLRTGLLAAAAVAGLTAALVAVELAVRRLDPQEVDGWGERESLAPDPEFGWHLKPSCRTRLRWESYDYTVTSNALGFPGPDVPEAKPPNTFRILTTGDAFTSAEGVDTELAWPRLLETALAARLGGRRVEVLNFAITGHGPNEYAAVVREFVPRFKPDLILAEFFVNDFQDVLSPTLETQARIGFGRRAQDGWRGLLTVSHLRRWNEMNLSGPLAAALQGRPWPLLGYDYGNFASLECRSPNFETARRALADRLAEMKRTADRAGAFLIVPMVPASVQVCGPEQLPYYPHNVDLRDPERFDPELPQRTMRELAAPLDVRVLDLRPVLRAVEGGAYQPRNMHWLPRGHRAVADYLSDTLVREGIAKP